MTTPRIAAAAFFCAIFGSLGNAQILSGTHLPEDTFRPTPYKGFHNLITTDIAGRPLPQFPGFSFVQTFYEGTDVNASVDLARLNHLTPGTYELFVVADQTATEWAPNEELIDVRGSSQTVSFTGSTVASNAVTIDTGTLSADAGLRLAIGYDVVIDVDGDGRLTNGDVIDGYGAEPGFYVVRDPSGDGPLGTIETNVTVTGVKAGFEGENLFYPDNISSMGKLPLIVISHGNGHNYNWYDHLGHHFASWGFVVMSHRNDTVPGIQTASQTTLTHTDAFLGSLGTLDGGILDGHVDVSQIMWIGHSRGAEGIVRAYDKLFDGFYVPTNYDIENIKGLSSIAPTIFLSKDDTNPHTVPFHLWTGASDNDVNGCASSSIVYTFLTHERALGDRFSTYLHGAGHGAFHNGAGSLVATGPCQLNRDETHRIMKAYLLPLAHNYFYNAPEVQELLWRQDEEFQPAIPIAGPCIVVNKTYQRRTTPRFVVDNFQTFRELLTSSQNGAVSYTAKAAREGAFDDPDSNFTYSESEFMNGMTYSITGEDWRGVTLGWNTEGGDAEWEVVAAKRDISTWRYFSFRAGQITRDPNTTAALGDLTFAVELRDEDGNTSSINIGAYGGGLEEPYQRTSCGSGTGWSNFFETIRIPVADFTTDGTVLDLTRIEAVRFVFGPSFGSTVGRIGIDDLELTNG